MAATNNLEGFGGSAQLACSIASLATGSSRESASQSNTTNKYFDYIVSLTFTIITGTPAAGASVNVYANAPVDSSGTLLWPIIQLSSGAVFATAGTDASVGALGTPPNLRLIGSFGIQTTSSSGERTFRTEPYSVAAGFNGCPPAFSIIVENQTGLAFSASTTTSANYLDVNGIFTSSGN